MDLVYFGSGAFGLPTLERLAAHHRVRCIITQPDRPAGRGGRLTPTPIGAWAAEHVPGVPLLKPDRVNERSVCAQVRAFPADAWVVIAFGQKLGRALLEDRFAINLHASLLPRWRGAAPINAAVLAGDAETGNSVITLADRMDAGDILAQSRRPLDPALTAGELHDLLAADGPDLVEGVLRAHAEGTLAPRPQDETLVTLAPKLTKADGWVDFAQPADACRRRIHGLTPWPGVTAALGGRSLRLLRVEPADADPQQSAVGTIVDPDRGTVACGGATALRLLTVQPAGGRDMPWADFARGHRIELGATLASGPGGTPC
ncbi:MAG TPA: methionyl-tRNA formyltransferase [Phycisphaerales bacterium]|nr:methionyl-tRNA formyltransferase [Phycisphaerales bacterium]